MPAQHSPNNHQIAVKFPHYVWRQIEKASEYHRMSTSEFIRSTIIEKVAGIEITAEDAQLIADRIKRAMNKGKGKMV